MLINTIIYLAFIAYMDSIKFMPLDERGKVVIERVTMQRAFRLMLRKHLIANVHAFIKSLKDIKNKNKDTMTEKFLHGMRQPPSPLCAYDNSVAAPTAAPTQLLSTSFSI
jgi:hypothetical protein